MVDFNKIFVVVPVFNEKKVIRETITGLRKAGYKNIVVVNDGSTEPVKEELEELEIIYLEHEYNRGQGAALQTGFDFLKKRDVDVVVTFDADGQHNPDDIKKMVDLLCGGQVDIVLGSRTGFGLVNTSLFIKKVLLLGGRIVNFVLTGLWLSDAHNGLRAFNRKTLEVIKFTQPRMAHASEILFIIKKNKLRFKEVKVDIHYTEYSIAKGQTFMNSFRILFDLLVYRFFR